MYSVRIAGEYYIAYVHVHVHVNPATHVNTFPCECNVSMCKLNKNRESRKRSSRCHQNLGLKFTNQIAMKDSLYGQTTHLPE